PTTDLRGGSLHDAGVPGTHAPGMTSAVYLVVGLRPPSHTCGAEVFPGQRNVSRSPRPGTLFGPVRNRGPPGLRTVISTTTPSPRSAAKRPSIDGTRKRSWVA